MALSRCHRVKSSDPLSKGQENGLLASGFRFLEGGIMLHRSEEWASNSRVCKPRGHGLLLQEPVSRRQPPAIRFKVWGKTASCSLDLKDGLLRLGFRGWPRTLGSGKSRGRPPAVRPGFRGMPPTLGSGEPRGRPPAVRLGFRGWPPTLEDLESLEDGLLL